MLIRERFFDTNELSDITIKFSGREVKCHKVILCSASEYFQGLCGARSRFIESGQNVIELKDDEDADAVEAMIAYIYSFDYSERFKEKADDAVFHFNVLVTANKYLIPKLASRACVKLAVASDTLQDDPEKAWALIQQHAKYPDQNEAVDVLVKDLKKQHLPYLLANPEAQRALSEDTDFQDLIKDRLAAGRFFKEKLQKVVIVSCCSGPYFPVASFQVGRVWCEWCGRDLLINGQLCHGVFWRYIWERVADASG